MSLQWSQSGPLLSASVGDHGPDVRALQLSLQRAGLKVMADGKMGPGTMQAVRSWQKAARLTTDGLPGANTWDTLRAAGHTRLDDVPSNDEDLTNAIVALRAQVLMAAAILQSQEGMLIVAELDRDLGLPLAQLPAASLQQPAMAGAPAVGILAAIGAALARMGPRALPVLAKFAARSATWLRANLANVPRLWSGTRKVQLPTGQVTIAQQGFKAQDAARGAARLAQRLVNWLGAGLGLGAAVSTVATTAPEALDKVVEAGSNALFWLLLAAFLVTQHKER